MKRVTLTLNGDKVVLNSLRRKDGQLDDAQKRAGLKMMGVMRREARAIIKQNAPKTSQSLYESITMPTANKWGNQYGQGWRFLLTSNAPYAETVESGGAPELKYVENDVHLQDWIIRVLPPEVASRIFSRGWIVVRQPGRNPHYDTTTGMGFFRIPVAKHSERTYTEFRNHVNNIVKKR